MVGLGGLAFVLVAAEAVALAQSGPAAAGGGGLNIISMEGVITQVTAGLMILLLSAICVFLYKLPQTLKAIHAHVKESATKIEELEKKANSAHERLDIYDSISTTRIGRTIRTDLMVSGRMNFPNPEDLKPPKE